MSVILALGFATVIVVACFSSTEPEQDSHPDKLRVQKVRPEIVRLVQKSDVIVLGKVTKIYDSTAIDAGMGYDVDVQEILYGKRTSTKTLHFKSSGWIGYAKYQKEEKVLLFLTYWEKTLIQLKPVCYVSETTSPEARMGLSLFPLDKYLAIITTEIENRSKKHTGTYTQFYGAGLKEEEWNYKDGRLHGPWTRWRANGKKWSQHNYKNGEKDGKQIGWHENGKKSAEWYLQDGKRHGAYTCWYDNGQKELEYTYKNGKLDGKAGMKWGEKGNVIAVMYYKNGKLIRTE